jgi:hypothetical protein
MAVPTTFDELCQQQAEGRGVIPWCRERDVRYLDVMRWIESDPERSFAFDLATRARGTTTVAQLESVSRQALNGTVDPRAAAVASKNLQWLAGVFDRKRYGEQMRIDHKHGLAGDHLSVLKQLHAQSVAAIEHQPNELQRGPGIGGTREAQGGLRSAPRESQHAPQMAHARVARDPHRPVIEGQFHSVPDPGRQDAAPPTQAVDSVDLFDV